MGRWGRSGESELNDCWMIGPGEQIKDNEVVDLKHFILYFLGKATLSLSRVPL